MYSRRTSACPCPPRFVGPPRTKGIQCRVRRRGTEPGTKNGGNAMPSTERGESLPLLPHLSDATLRDSAHMGGVEFGPKDAAVIADLLVRTGIDLVEVGMVSGP